MYKYLFGPIPSRRLGMSLGVDLVPHKVCSLDCVYCEVGKTTELTLARKEYVNVEKIKDEITHYFKNNKNPDYITFSGFGEPTLNVSIDKIIRFIKQNIPTVPVALITNGTLFFEKEVRDSIKNVDLLLPSLDAVTEDVFQRINRPHNKLSSDKYIQGLTDLRKDFKGKIWLEIFILPGYNDTIDELLKLKNEIIEIHPDLVQINTLDRPGTMHNLRGATKVELQQIIDLWNLDNVEVIAKFTDNNEITSFRTEPETVIFETISRRPCTLDDLSKILGLQPNKIMKHISDLEKQGKIETITSSRGVFYRRMN